MRNYQPRYSKGDRIGGRYLVYQALLGGMGEVYLCLDEEENYPYALKTFQGSDLHMRDLFEQEVANWIALEKHPNIVRLFHMRTLDNITFMMLEWITSDESRGSDLRSWLRNGPLDLELALKFTIDIVRGLQHANEKSPGIVHRDLKPDNVLVNQSRQAKITDFGLATVVQETDLDITGEDTPEGDLGQSIKRGNVVGTPPYMPPEQWRGETNLDSRTDMYAVGCILYELLTGRWVYEGRSHRELQKQHLESSIPKLNGEASQKLNAILANCLAKAPSSRYQHLEMLFTDLKTLYERYSDVPLPDIADQTFMAEDYSNRALSYAQLGQYERAINDLDQAIQLNPKFAQFYNNRGKTYGDMGQLQRALADLDQALQLKANYAGAHLNRGKVYVGLGDLQRALADFNQALQLNPDLKEAYVNRGGTYGKLGDHQRALTDFNRALQLDSNLKEAHLNRGMIYARLGDYQRAIAEFDQALQLDPYYVMAYMNRGSAYASLEQHQRAITDFDRTIELDPNYAGAYVNRGNRYSALGDYQRAIAEFDQALQLDPSLVPAYMNKAIAFAMSDQFEKALEWGQKAAQMGAPYASEFIKDVRKDLDNQRKQNQSNPDDPQAAFEAFQHANSLEAMAQTVQKFPIILDMIPDIERIIREQVPPEAKPAFEQRLDWLVRIIRQAEENWLKQLVRLYGEQDEIYLRQKLNQQGATDEEITKIITVVKDMSSGGE